MEAGRAAARDAFKPPLDAAYQVGVDRGVVKRSLLKDFGLDPLQRDQERPDFIYDRLARSLGVLGVPTAAAYARLLRFVGPYRLSGNGRSGDAARQRSSPSR